MLDVAQCPPEFAERYRREGYWRGETLDELLREWSSKDPTRVAITAAGARHTYGELNLRADRLAAGLVDLGIQRGDRVVVQLPNVVEFAIVTIALFRARAVPVFALSTHRRNEITHLCSHAQAVAYVAMDLHHGFDYRQLAREMRDAVPSLRHVLVVGEGQEFTSLRSVDAEPRMLAPPAPGEVAFFLLSGGTTGLPKLIPRTHDDYAYQLRATAEGLRFDQDSVYLAALPIAHNAALGCPGLLGTLRAGGKVVLLDNASPDEAFALIKTERVTLTTLMPPLVQVWLEAADSLDVDCSRMTLQVGSARFAPDLARRARMNLGCRLTQWFGMAEGLLTFTRLDDPEEVVDNTQGRALCAADEIRVVDEHGNDVEPGALGELLTRGPYTLRGYYKVPEHNERAFTSDGFLRTGDLVKITSAGNMIVEGRLKDVINRGGEKIGAGEVEDLLLEHPDVREVAAVAMPDELFGERVCVFLVARDAKPSLPGLKVFLRGRGLAEYKLPDRLELVGSLPRTKVGKIDKARLREMIATKLCSVGSIERLHVERR